MQNSNCTPTLPAGFPVTRVKSYRHCPRLAPTWKTCLVSWGSPAPRTGEGTERHRNPASGSNASSSPQMRGRATVALELLSVCSKRASLALERTLLKDGYSSCMRRKGFVEQTMRRGRCQFFDRGLDHEQIEIRDCRRGRLFNSIRTRPE